MRLDMWEVLSSLTGLFLLIAAGYGAVRLGVLPGQASAYFSRLVLKLTLPCTIFVSLLRPYDPGFFRDVGTALALGLVVLPVNALLSVPLGRLLRVPDGRRGVWSFCVTFANNAFMGLPVSLALFGEEGLALAAVFGIPYNLQIYSLGAWMVSRDAPPGSGGASTSLRSLLLTGVNGAAVLGLGCCFFNLTLPGALLTPLTHLSNVTTPLSMFVTGMNLAGTGWSAPFRDRDALTAAAVRLAVLPLVSYALLRGIDGVFPLANPLMFGVVFLITAMPSPAAATLLAEDRGADREFAARAVFLSSLFCVASIPVMAMLL